MLTLDRKLRKYVFAEKKERKGTEHISLLIEAIKNSKIVEFRYRKFDNTITKEKRIVEPYALKEFKGRWYLLAVEIGGRLEERGQIKTWGLDRIENFHLTNNIFSKNIHLNVQNEFENCFGIHSDKDKETEEVILSFAPMSGKYNEAFPLHETQETLIDNETEFRIKLKVKITYDFIMELLSQSEGMKVIAPNHLKDKLIDIHKKAIESLQEVV
jgi:predicted DNA-binding transcriptional regulator YafY